MALVSGPLSTVTTTPSAVSQVNVSINSPRTLGTGVMTPEVKTVAVTGGDFSSQIAPGPAVLSLLIGGRESAPIPILVGDVESQTLAEVVEAARLATGQTQESLAQFVQQVLGEIYAERDSSIDYATTQIGEYRDEALNEAGLAIQAAKDANTVPRVTALEAMAGLSPESPVDGQTANLIAQPGTLTAAALSKKFSTEAVGQPDFATLIESTATSGTVGIQRSGNDVLCKVDFGDGLAINHTFSGYDDYLAAMNVSVEHFATQPTPVTEHYGAGDDITVVSGNFTTPQAGSTRYATSVGATWEMPLTTGDDGVISMRFYGDTRGGMWSITLDDGTPVNISTYRASGGFFEQDVFTGVTAGDHVLRGVFEGDDPNNPPSSTARGWLSQPDPAYQFISVASMVSGQHVTTSLSGRSNREFAWQVAPADTPDVAKEIIPFHGVATAFTASPRRYILDGKDLSWEDLPDDTGAPLAGRRFQVVQHVYGRHSTQPGVNLVEFWTTTTIHPSGKISVSGKWHVIKDIVLGTTAYLAMCPAVGEIFDQWRTGLANVYSNSPDKYGSVTWMEPESDLCETYIGTSSHDPDLVVSFTIREPAESLRRGRDRKAAETRRVFLEHRSAGSVKIYPRPWGANTILAAGESGRWSADWVYHLSPGAGVLYN